MWTRSDRLAAVLVAVLLAVGGAALAQSPEPPSPVEPPEAIPQEALEDQLEEQAEDSEERGFGPDRGDRERYTGEIREEVRRKLRQASRRSDAKVSFGSSIHIDEDEVTRDLVTIGGSIRVDGDIYGDAIAVGGNIEVNGKVTGDLVAVGGGVELGPNAEVLGEVTSVGGQVRQDDDARVLGRVNEVSVGSQFMTWDLGGWGDRNGDDHEGWRWRFRPGGWGFGMGPWIEFGRKLTFLVMLALLACLVQLIGGDTVERVRGRAPAAPFVAGLVGLAVQLLLVPVLVVVCLILTLSIIGIPLLLLIPFVFLAMLLAWLVGYTGSAMAVGRWFEGRFNRSFSSPFTALLVGIGVIQSMSVIASFLDFLPGFLWMFTAMFGVAGFLFQYAAWTIGLGSVFLHGFRRSPERPASPPAAPPAPPPPASDPAPEPFIDPPMDSADPSDPREDE